MIIAPSLLAADFRHLDDQLRQVAASAARWLHYDVMDGHFVDNLTFGPGILRNIAGATDLVKDVHLMVEDPLKIAEMFLIAVPDYLTIHYEATDQYESFVTWCRQAKIKPGISLKPETDVKVLDSLGELFDLVLLMSVQPGFGSQSFMPEVLDKICYLKAKDPAYLIEVDGGINKQTAVLCRQAGADVLVAGSYIFGGDIKQRVDDLL